ncbi:MAG: VWA domain-containing protein [Candidatus Sumerlaeia bacterium]|nr:VWA domain-containing protein [Candidatus Sumerlaeia bacterium]
MLDWRFLHPWFLALLPLPLIWLAWHYWRRRDAVPALVYSDAALLAAGRRTWRTRAVALMPAMRAGILLLGIVALARPQYGQVQRRQAALGIDIGLVLDVSGSMDYPDFPPNRLEVAKGVLKDFVAGRETDRVSLVVFGSSAALLCPPTFDHVAVQQFIDFISPATFARDQRMTAVGDGLGLAVSKLVDSEAASKVVILLTDGDNNEGRLDPLQAADAAAALGVRVYTIGVGTDGPIQVPTTDLFGRRVMQTIYETMDEEVLRQMAAKTGGRYFRATDAVALRRIYEEIDKLEKIEIEVSQYDDYDERFQLLWLPALMLLGIEFLLRGFVLGRVP